MFRRDPKRRSSGYRPSSRSSDGPGRRASQRSGEHDDEHGEGGEGGEEEPSLLSRGRAAAENPRARATGERFILYVEGARDREVLAGWARHVAPVFGGTLERSTVILGGRQPARAVEHFRRRGGASAGLSGLVVLDRDDHPEDRPAANELEPGLELFIWSLRHIESYLLVPAAIRRIAPHAPDDRTLQAWIERHAAADPRLEVRPGRRVGPHAKRMLGAGGALGDSLGVELRAGEIAKAMRRDELHADVHELFARIAALRGVAFRPVVPDARRDVRAEESED